MSAQRIGLLALVLSALAASPAAGALDPQLPADGATVSAGSPVTFRVASAPDQTLFVNVSRSQAIADAGCGTIGTDAELESLSPTSDPSVYEGTPQVFELYDFWLNRAGTYYWQAYRHVGGGCEISAVRRLDVTGIRGVEIAPQPLQPDDGATLPTGPLSFRVSVAPIDPPNYLWIHVSRSPQRTQEGNLIGFDAEIEELTPTADPTVWTATPKYFEGSSFWMNQPGTYYWQPFRISGFGDPDGFVEGQVRSFTLQGAPPPPPEPVTVRGDEAFMIGTANDLYLACTKLDLWVIDVLPAPGNRVSVTGAADLRLKGRTVDILLDGKRVGTAVVGSSGAFAGKVRAPSKARRAKARYQARVGSTVSQNLRLVRRMVAARLTSSGNRMTLTGRITKPFAKRADTIRIQRYRTCNRKDTIKVKAVRPSSSGNFKVTFTRPAESVKALMFRATTRVAGSPRGRAKILTFTLPRAIDVG